MSNELIQKAAEALDIALGKTGVFNPPELDFMCAAYDGLVAALQPSLKQDLEEAEPVAWHTEDHLTDKSATTYDRYCAERWKQKGWPVTPLYYCSEATPPGKVLVPVAELRPKIIDCLLATSGLSDGVAADAIVSILTASNGE